jgi:hypothetical protein
MALARCALAMSTELDPRLKLALSLLRLSLLGAGTGDLKMQ